MTAIDYRFAGRRLRSLEGSTPMTLWIRVALYGMLG
jgi:hypothetical protein